MGLLRWFRKKAKKKRTSASAKYEIWLSCIGKICVRNVVTEECDGLSLVPGNVMDDSSLACMDCAVEIEIPPCVTSWKETILGRVEKISQTIGDCSCNAGWIWTSTRKQADTDVVRVGEMIGYTVIFTNHSSFLLEAVRIYDEIPDGVTVVPDTIDPAPGPGETLETGVSVGNVAAGSSIILRYSAVVENCAPDVILNRARVTYCFRDCRGCCRLGVGGYRSCSVKLLPGEAEFSVEKRADKTSVCWICEEITYTLTVLNSGNMVLEDVVIYDHIPHGLCYQRGSTSRNGGAALDENPEKGIAIGSLNPGECYVITFVAVVCMQPACQAVTEYVNKACVYGKSGESCISAESNPWVVTMDGRCLTQSIETCFSLCHFKCLLDCFLYQTGSMYYDCPAGKFVKGGFGIGVKYIDCCGKRQEVRLEDSFVVLELPDDFNPAQFTIRLTDFCYSVSCSGKLYTKFTVQIFYQKGKK